MQIFLPIAQISASIPRFIAQLDMWMADEAHMRQYIEAFMEAEAEAQQSAKRTGPESS